MSSNEQRREDALRKLEQQLEQRARQERRRKVLSVAGGVVGVALVVGGAVGLYLLNKDNADTVAQELATTESELPPEPETTPMPPARATALPATVDCAYEPAGEAAGEVARPAEAPSGAAVGAEGTVAAAMQTSAGAVGLVLDRAMSPCTVNSFTSLAAQGYFDDTVCHRLTTEGIYVLQCGDPTGTGMGGPGYQFANEFPTDQYAPDDPVATLPMNYARGTVAMANAGPGTNGSQFFLVYQDSPLPPQYTVFGTVDEAGLAVLDTIAETGAEGGAPDGAPATPVAVSTVTLPS